jgi:hypothetical protein
MNPLGGMFQEPEQKRTFGQKAMNVVRNFGAGLAGFGPEFIAMQRQEQRQLDEQRQKAMAQDAMKVYEYLNDNRIDDAISLVDQRVKYINELGGDPTDTLEIRQMLTTPGRLDEARQELGLFVQASMENGLLPAPRVPEQFTLAPGEVRFDDQGAEIARGDSKPSTDLARKFVQQIMPNGTFRTLQTDQRGNFFDAAGNSVRLDANSNLVEGTVMQGKPEDFNTTSAEFRQLRDRESATMAAIATVGDMLGMLQENPNINTFVSSAAGLVNNLTAEAKALASAAGMQDEVNRLINPDTFSGEFNELGIRNRQMQSLVSNLAYTVARANDPSGRVSDADVRNAVREIGSSSSDPIAFARVLNDVARRAERSFQIDYKTRTGGDFTGSLGTENFPDFNIRDAGGEPAIPTPMTQEEFDALPSGAMYIDPDDRKQYRKP